jgi:hypothetical protein
MVNAQQPDADGIQWQLSDSELDSFTSAAFAQAAAYGTARGASPQQPTMAEAAGDAAGVLAAATAELSHGRQAEVAAAASRAGAVGQQVPGGWVVKGVLPVQLVGIACGASQQEAQAMHTAISLAARLIQYQKISR